jgi:DNA-binding NarL/FixJ family response regulator
MRETHNTILYIEDDRETAALIAEDLNERGFQVAVAHDALEGYAAIVKLHPDLVLCDLSMPAASGFEVLKRLTAAAPHFLNMPFIFLSAMTDREIELKARRLGADDFITKPIDFDLLAAIVTSRLARVVHGDPIPKRTDISGRETEVLTWAARGKTSAEIAIIMELSKRTVDFHFDNARMKLGTISRIDTVICAVSGRLIDP